MSTLRQDALSFVMSDGTRRAPAELYRRLLAEAPVLDLGPVWVVSGYEEITALTRNPAVSCDPSRTGHTLDLLLNLADIVTKSLPMRDGDDHTRLRRLTAASFSARGVASLTPVVTRVVDDLFAPHLDRGTMDVVADLATPLPVALSCALLDIPEADRPAVRDWATLISRSLIKSRTAPEDQLRLDPAVAELREYVAELCAERTARPGPDLISRLAAARQAGTIDDEELFAYVVMLFTNGLETLTSGLASAVWYVLHDPGLPALLRARPELAEPVFDECLRVTSPVRVTARAALTDIDVAGARIPEGSAIVLLLAAANQDPRRFPDPERFDPARTEPHLALGHGPHHCLGAALSQVSGGRVLAYLAAHCDELATPLTEETAAWNTSLSFNGLDALPITFAPRRGCALDTAGSGAGAGAGAGAVAGARTRTGMTG